MKKAIALLLTICLLTAQYTIACTTFLINTNGQLVFGRNYDWMTGSGMVSTNLRGLFKKSANQGKDITISWVSRYGSITFNQYGKEFPTGGMNEKGLVVEIMWLDGSRYPKPDHRASMDVLQWVQFQLDNHSTIEEVIATDDKIRISPENPPLHYLVADASGKAATIEFLNGKMVVHKGKELPFPVLTNSTYDQSIKAANSANIAAGNTRFSFQDNSLQRFATACSMVQQYSANKIDKPVVDYSFDILNKVSNGDYTKWSIVYDIKNLKVYFKTYGYNDVKSIAYQSLDFSCSAGSKVINMNQAMKGDINSLFKPFSEEANRTVVEKSVVESKGQVPIDEATREFILAYPRDIKCKQ